MSLLPARWRDSSRSLPGFPLVLLVALGTALGAQLLCILAGNTEGIIFWEEFRKGDLVLGWISFALVLTAPLILRFCGRVPWRRIGNWLEGNVLLVAVLGLLLYAFLMHWGARNVPYTPDEVCAVLQARTFAALRDTSQVAPELARLVIPEWIQDDFVIFSAKTGRYTPTYWPGYALVMAPFARFGLEWLCNPALTALSLVVLFRLTRRLTQSGEGGAWALVLALAAPQIAINAATYFSMPAHLLFNLVFCSLLVRDTKRATFGAGLVGGFALVLHNPVPHFTFALPWIAWLALKRRSHLIPLLAGYALLFLPIGLGWSAHLQDFDAGRYVKEAAATATSAPSASAGGLQKFAEVVSRVAYVIRPPDTYLWLSRGAGICKFIIWAVPGAATLAVLGWAMARRERLSRRQATKEGASATSNPIPDYLWLFGASLTLNFVLYMFVRFDQGHGWGFRYLHQSWMFLAILPAYFLVRMNANWKKLAAVFCLGSVFVMLPLRALQLRVFMDDILAKGPATPPTAPSITFIREIEQRVTFIQNDPFLSNSHWNLRSQSPAQNAALAKRYLANAQKVQSGTWGERWQGSGFQRSGSTGQ